MLTLALALLAAALLARSWEGSIRVRWSWTGYTLARVGRVSVGLYVFRPGCGRGQFSHAYVRVEVDGGRLVGVGGRA